MEKRQKVPKKFKFRRYHHLAIELRYGGKTYKEIAESLTKIFKVNIRPDRIGHWFASSGILEQPYLDFANKESERSRRLVLEELKKLAPRIPKKLIALLERSDESGKPKLDAVTLGTLKLMCDMFNVNVPLPAPKEAHETRIEAYLRRLQELPLPNSYDQSPKV